MHKMIVFASLVASAGFSQADASQFVPAEELVQHHTSSQASNIGAQLGVRFYDGPVDGELPLYACEFFDQPDCVNYRELAAQTSGVDSRTYSSNELVESFIYYAAYRNVVAGLYSPTVGDEYQAFLEEVGIRSLLETEVYLLKNGEKPLTLFQGNVDFEPVLTETKAIYNLW
tara:strand:+ start:8416 stop:8931 length:516 start_codon:yes stop_codon:yes gene_type:complete